MTSSTQKAFEKVELDKGRRFETRVKPEVIFHEGETPDAYLPGTITLWLAKRGSQELKELSQAIKSKKSDKINELNVKLWKSLKRPKPMILEKAASIITKEKVYCDIRYAGKDLANYLILRDKSPATVVIMPYAGGQLDPEKFEVINYAEQLAENAHDSLVIIRKPQLNFDEAAMLDKVPNYATDSFIGASSFCPAVTLFATAVLAAHAIAYYAVYVTITGVIVNKNFVKLNNVHLSAQQLEKYGAVNSARQLVRMRRELLNKIIKV